MEKKNKITNEDYIKKNVVWRDISENYVGVSFICADGYRFESCGVKTAASKKGLLGSLIQSILTSGHPVQ